MQKAILLFLLVFIQYVLPAQATFFKSINNGSIRSVAPARNGGIIAAGSYSHYSSSEDIYRGILVKIDAQGTVEWARHFPSIQKINACIAVPDGYMITGDSSDSFWLSKFTYFAKLDTLGSVVWAKKFTTDRQEHVPGQIFSLPDGGFILNGGVSSTFFSNGVAMCRTDSSGNIIWSKVYKSTHPTFHGDYLVKEIQGDTLYAVGQVQGNGIFMRIHVETGEVLGVSSFGGIYREGFRSLVPSEDGNFILAGMTRTTTSSEEERPWITKVNRTGQMIWSKTYNLIGWNQTCEIVGVSSGGCVFSTENIEGGASSQSILSRIDSAGNLMWANNYTSGLASGLESLVATTDNGFVAIDRSRKLIKINELGRTNNGCCPIPVVYEVTDFNPPYQTLSLFEEPWRSVQPYILKSFTDTLFFLNDACETSMATVASSIQVCQGDSWEYNGVNYVAPGVVRDTVYSLTGACDTVFEYNLVQIPQPFIVQTISTCPGSEIIFNGVTYTQPGVVNLIIPATEGCDTLRSVFLRFDQWPKKYQITQICPGDTVYVDGTPYTQPGTIFPPDTLAGPPGDCDTLLFQKLEYPNVASTVTITCPENIRVQTSPGKTIPVFFDNPLTGTTCVCDSVGVWQSGGQPSGSSLPAGVNEVCFWAGDYCGATQECCFTIEVAELEACDVKPSGPIVFELLDVSNESNGDITYRMRVRNEGLTSVDYLAFELPDGTNALAPPGGSMYQSQSGRAYSVKNPSASPFHSIRFKAVSPLLVNGLEDIFAYTIPAQLGISFVQCVARLVDGNVYEAKLNTFNCQGVEDRLEERNTRLALQLPAIQVYPNPTNGAITIQWDGKMEGDFVIKDLMGRALFRYKCPADKLQIKIQLPETLQNGMYMLEVISDSQCGQAHKFVLERN